LGTDNGRCAIVSVPFWRFLVVAAAQEWVSNHHPPDPTLIPALLYSVFLLHRGVTHNLHQLIPSELGQWLVWTKDTEGGRKEKKGGHFCPSLTTVRHHYNLMFCSLMQALPPSLSFQHHDLRFQPWKH
jgi:hypothetical protein